MLGSVRMRLSIMMFMQYAVWGVWAPTLAKHLGGLESFREDTGYKIGMIYMTMAIASMLSPFIAGQIADRYFSTEKFLAFSHFVGGILLLWAWYVNSYEVLFWIMLGHCILYAPTVPLTNSLSFHHLPNGEKEFGAIRLWGTIGWIAVGWAFSGFLGLPESVTAFLPWKVDMGNCLAIGGVLSFFMAAFCLTLPHTPPSPKAENPFAFIGAIKLAKDRSFAVLLIVAFLVSTELQFYYVLTPNFFGDQPGLSLSSAELKRFMKLDDKQAAEIKTVLVQFGATGKSVNGTINGIEDDRVTTLMRLLDVNRNNKLSLAELKDMPRRVHELQQSLKAIEGDADKKYTAKELEAILRPAGIGAEPPPAQNFLETIVRFFGFGPQSRTSKAIADYVQTAADDDQDQTVTRSEVEGFLARATPLLTNAEQAQADFSKVATDKGGLNLSDSWLIIAMTIGQVAEIFVLMLLPLSLSRLGFGTTIAIGIAAWAVRYAIFALGTPVALVVLSQSLHGFGFGFFFVGAMIYSDRIAPKDIRASAQSLLIFVTFGVGMLISSLIAGRVADYFQFNWHLIFLLPVAITGICTVLFLLGFRETKMTVDKDALPLPPPADDEALRKTTEIRRPRISEPQSPE